MKQQVMQKVQAKPKPQAANVTGIPTQMKRDFEQRSGLSFDDVRVHYRSKQPAKFGALAYTQGTQVYIGPGQEKYLRHELGHVVQQKTRPIPPTTYKFGVPINRDLSLEREADSLALSSTPVSFCGRGPHGGGSNCFPMQLFALELDEKNKICEFAITRNDVPGLNPPLGLSGNHSTAFTVFIYTLNFGLLGKSPAEAGAFFQFLYDELLKMPGAANASQRELTQFQHAVTEFQSRYGQANQVIPEQYRDHVFTLCKSFLSARNSLAYTYLPGNYPAFGCGEAGVMPAIHQLLDAAKTAAPTSKESIILELTNHMVHLFDTLHAPRGSTGNDSSFFYVPFIRQHLASMRVAFSPQLTNAWVTEIFEAALENAYMELLFALGQPLNRSQLAQLKREAQVDLLSRTGRYLNHPNQHAAYTQILLQNKIHSRAELHRFLDQRYQETHPEKPRKGLFHLAGQPK